MADYIEPTKTAFTNAEQVAIDALTTASPDLITKTGSVIRELVIRPVAYLLSWVRGNIAKDFEQYSVSYLKTSQLTENPIADAVASNYFVTRRQGTGSRGVVTMTLSSSVLRLAAGSRFTVGSEQCTTTVQYMISNTPGEDTDDVVYIKSIPYIEDGTQYWIANIPVVTVNTGKIEIPLGTQVSVNFGCPTLVQVDLTSPITGGTDTETDAQLMQRAEYNTAEAGIGTYYGIKKKLAKAPVAVAGMAVLAGEDRPLYRGRFNTVSINPGGFVDCHVKTSNQAITGYTDMRAYELVGSEEDIPFGQAYYTHVGAKYTIVCKVPSSVCTGFLRVSSIISGATQVPEYVVQYESKDPNTSADGARLSADQIVVVTFELQNPEIDEEEVDQSTTISYIPVRLYMTYMAGIDPLQSYMDKDTEHFIGQDIKIKAAIPVMVDVACTVSSNDELTEDDITGIKQAIVDYVNSTNVGSGILNFSDIRSSVLTLFPNIDLRLPCTLSASVYTTDGSIDTFYSTSGILDITKTTHSNYWGYQLCFFSSVLNNIRLNIL
jgi:hypothetical protein